MSEKRSNKLTTTIRLDPAQREALEAVADREMRTLSNEITFLLQSALEQYLKEHNLGYDKEKKSLFYL